MPMASATAVFVLAIAISFSVSFLSLYVDLVLRPFPGMEQSDQLGTVGQLNGNELIGMPVEIVDRMSDEMTSIESVGMWIGASALVGSQFDATNVAMVSEGFFRGLRPL
jgi:hypothetical protein